MTKGNQPTDGGHLILTATERAELISRYPESAKWIKRYMGAEDFIHSHHRYCLWLIGVDPREYRTLEPIAARLENVRATRIKSPTPSVRNCADTPMLFSQIRQPERPYLAVPQVTTERRKYIPLGILQSDVIASNGLYVIREPSYYLCGLLMSSTHMLWTASVCGRLGNGYRYSPAVYHEFPVPNVTTNQKTSIESLTLTVLETRSLFPASTLADLYDPSTMPAELLKAHKNLDREVMKLYGFPTENVSESQIISALFERYEANVDLQQHNF